jgi:membrane protein GlpM
MNYSELALRFFAGGSLVVAVSILAKTKSPLLAGLFVLFPAITLIGYYFIGQTVESAYLKKITLFSIAALPTTFVFLITFYLVIDRFSLLASLGTATLAWCGSAMLLVALNHYFLRIGL